MPAVRAAQPREAVGQDAAPQVAAEVALHPGGDWVIDMGPEAGVRGGCIVAEGTPEAVAAHPDSVTGRFLAEVLPGMGVG